MNSIQSLADNAVAIQKQIDALKAQMKPLEEESKTLKAALLEEMKKEGIKKLEGPEANLTFVSTNRSTVDYKTLCNDYEITEAKFDTYKKTNESTYIKITLNK